MQSSLYKKPVISGKKFLVFTSAGDNSNLECWLDGPRNFNLCIGYYGEYENRYREYADYYFQRKGGKFSNLHHVYQNWRDIFSHYQAVLVIDDDILIGSQSINKLFEIQDQYNLLIMQPSFDPRGKISYPITISRPFSFMRYTNFVEMNCPLFKRDVLDRFMDVFDPDLVSYGTDLWYMDLISDSCKGNVAIIDKISCINPLDKTKKNGKREIDLLEDSQERISAWERLRKKYNIRTHKITEYDSVKDSASMGNYFNGACKLIINCLYG